MNPVSPLRTGKTCLSIGLGYHLAELKSVRNSQRVRLELNVLLCHLMIFSLPLFQPVITLLLSWVMTRAPYTFPVSGCPQKCTHNHKCMPIVFLYAASCQRHHWVDFRKLGQREDDTHWQIHRERSPYRRSCRHCTTRWQSRVECSGRLT